MSKIKKLIEKFNGLSTSKKVQLIAASLLTLFVIIGLPIYAWFALTSSLDTMTKVERPSNLDIRAGNYDPVVNFDLRDIDIEEIKKNGAKGYVFSVSAGDYKIDYDIQIAHTTNIPLTYTLYKATEVEAKVQCDVIYAPLNDSTQETYYKKAEKIDLSEKNVDGNSASNYGRNTALDNDNFYGKTYENTDKPELYAVPIYLQTVNPVQNNETSDEHDYFILELGWDTTAAEKTGFAQWNIADNNKETDIIYITAEKHIDQ